MSWRELSEQNTGPELKGLNKCAPPTVTRIAEKKLWLQEPNAEKIVDGSESKWSWKPRNETMWTRPWEWECTRFN